MPREKKPYMPFFGADFYSDERVINLPSNSPLVRLACEALYLRMLWGQWREESVPDSVDYFARSVGCRPKELEKVWPLVREFFEEVDGRLRNPKMSGVRQEMFTREKKSAEHGAKGAAARWNAAGVTDARAIPEQCPSITENTSNADARAMARAFDSLSDSDSDSVVTPGEGSGERIAPESDVDRVRELVGGLGMRPTPDEFTFSRWVRDFGLELVEETALDKRPEFLAGPKHPKWFLTVLQGRSANPEERPGRRPHDNHRTDGRRAAREALAAPKLTEDWNAAFGVTRPPTG